MTLITEAVHARSLSAMRADRAKATAIYPDSEAPENSLSTDDLQMALYAAKIVSYAQGFSLLHSASLHYGWNLDLGSIAKIWRNGCIIRSAFLEKITTAFGKDPQLSNLLFDDFFSSTLKTALPAWRKVVVSAMAAGVPLPAMSSGLSYFDGLRTLHSSANLIQAQRDFFGAHTYERVDAPRGKFFHTNWTGKGGDTVSGTYNA